MIEKLFFQEWINETVDSKWTHKVGWYGDTISEQLKLHMFDTANGYLFMIGDGAKLASPVPPCGQTCRRLRVSSNGLYPAEACHRNWYCQSGEQKFEEVISWMKFPEIYSWTDNPNYNKSIL